MKRFALIGMCAAVLTVGFVGCDWDTGDDATSWSSSYNWVNFSGSYRSAAGGLLVTDYTTTPSTPGSTNSLQVTEGQGSFSANATAFNGKLKKTPIKPGTVVINFGYFSASDNGNGVLFASMGWGTIDYTAGNWRFTEAPQAQSAGSISASYAKLESNSSSAGSGARPGSTGSIYSFAVQHQGQHLTIVDNNGASYAGYIREMRTASGAERGDETERYVPVDGDTMVATFDCTGRSAAGMSVKIVGSFQGTVAASVFTGRILTGTWIELGGKTGDINGQTTVVPIAASTETATDAAATEEVAAE